ncbi:TetR/AcrR family transcriptional regulator [Shewanella youngdeokensis]|uniref:Helix-turn-helix domain-containing protein n=1 Tax=Shewanella youngdeokensis TaxID=2999068 RepID=A0ABZ0JX90_9GAMM|nr:helix-turn-helix domain-containing protein [Shewanella sp. DAU334]
MDVRNSILQAAEQEIAKRGIVQFSLSGLAHVIPTSKSTVYGHFPNKDELLVEIFNHQADKRILVGISLDNSTDLSTADKCVIYFCYSVYANLQNITGNGVRFLPSNPQLWKRAKPDTVECMKRQLKQIHTLPINYLKDARLTGELTATDAEINYAVIDLLTIERGAIINLTNAGLDDLMGQIDPFYFLQRMIERIALLKWAKPISTPATQIDEQIKSILKGRPFYDDVV